MKCTVCDNSEFTLIEGVYVCNECNNQVQSSLHEQSDQEGFSRRSLLRTSPGEKQGKAKKKGSVYDDWTTPEAYTLILRKQVTALINLGASDQLKNVVLHMWCLYLQKCQIAFRTDYLSKELVPRLGIFAPMRDRKVLYGNKLIERKMKIKKRKKTVPKKSTSQVKERRESAASDFADSEVSNPLSVVDAESEVNNTSSEIDDTESEKESDEELSRSVKISSAARKTLRTKKLHKNKHQSKQISVHELDLSKLLSFCHLGLIYTKDNLLLTDLLRLVNERKVPYLFATEHLPPTMKIKYGDTNVLRKKRAPDLWEVSSMSAKLVDFLKLPRFKHHYLMPIVVRYVTDLNLPGQIIPAIKNVIDDWKKGENEWYETRFAAGKKMLPVPLYEVQAMAVIIVALKLLFVLDGKYELEHSETMMKLNILLKSDKLFVWSEWRKRMSLKEFLFMKSGISYSDFSNLEKICPELIAKYSYCKPKPNEESDRATFRAFNSKQAIETLLRDKLNLHDAPPHRPSSFPVKYQLHYMMSEWKKWHCFKETEEIDFSFICKDFSSQLLFYDFESDEPDTDELIRLLLASLYESSEIFLLKHSHSSCKEVLCTSSQYWFKNFSGRTIKSNEWLEQLPEPFVWLLQMLSKYVLVSCRHLYLENWNIEKKLFLGMKKYKFPQKVYKK